MRERMKKGVEELPMPPLELVEEEVCFVAVPPPVVPVLEEEVQIHMEEESNLRRVFPRTTLAVLRSDDVVRFLLAVDTTFIPEFVNNPSGMDLDAVYIMMLTLDLPDLFGVMAWPANRRVKIRELLKLIIGYMSFLTL